MEIIEYWSSQNSHVSKKYGKIILTLHKCLACRWHCPKY